MSPASQPDEPKPIHDIWNGSTGTFTGISFLIDFKCFSFLTTPDGMWNLSSRPDRTCAPALGGHRVQTIGPPGSPTSGSLEIQNDQGKLDLICCCCPSRIVSFPTQCSLPLTPGRKGGFLWGGFCGSFQGCLLISLLTLRVGIKKSNDRDGSRQSHFSRDDTIVYLRRQSWGYICRLMCPFEE